MGKEQYNIRKGMEVENTKNTYFSRQIFCALNAICRDYLSQLYGVQRTLYRKQLPCSFSIFVALVF